jgi:glycosyltransferase involved in cell wall biosynthesis
VNILVTVSDQIWGGKHQYMFDVIQALREAGHSCLPVAESGSRMAARLSQAGIQVAVVPPFATEQEDATAAVRELLAERFAANVICVTGRHDAAAIHLARPDLPSSVMLVLFRHSAFPIDGPTPAGQAVSRADLIIATSFDQAERQFGYGQPQAANVDVVLSAVSQSFIDRCRRVDIRMARESLGVGDAFVFTVMARLDWVKGVDRVVRAMARVDAADHEVVLVVAGDGPLRGELEDLAASLGVSGRVRFAGHRSDIETVLAATDVAVLASVAGETGPLALKEAMAAGKPVIASSIPGIPEFVTDGVNGLLVSDDDQLVAAMRRLGQDPVLAAEIGQGAQESIRSGHMLAPRMRYLLALLDRQAIQTLPLEAVLAGFSWGKVRWRRERETGFLFVPRTSEITEIPARVYAVITDALERGTPAGLAGLPAEEARSMTGLLYDMGALVRSRPSATSAAA